MKAEFFRVKYLKKTWVRVIVSLLAGGFSAEIIHINSGDPNRPAGDANSYFVLIFAVIAFILLTSIVNKHPR
jgi:hypothetical protein